MNRSATHLATTRPVLERSPLRRAALLATLLGTLLLAALLPRALAHETVSVGSGDDRYDIVVGFAQEPPFTEERNGLDLIVRTSEARDPVEGLERSLTVEITSPDGAATRTLTLRTRWGAPGSYTDDFVLSVPGVYTVRVTGFVGAVEVDETFELHEVRELDTLRFP